VHGTAAPLGGYTQALESVARVFIVRIQFDRLPIIGDRSVVVPFVVVGVAATVVSARKNWIELDRLRMVGDGAVVVLLNVGVSEAKRFEVDGSGRANGDQPLKVDLLRLASAKVFLGSSSSALPRSASAFSLLF
jgi:hypothetical protein